MGKALRCASLSVLLLGGPGCRSLPPLPPADLGQNGWSIREGQAVWRARRDAPEIAGDLLIATRPGGETFVQFTKTPFPMVIARTTPEQWQIESPMENRRFTGRGRPPARLLWPWLPQLLSGSPAPAQWRCRRGSDHGWQISNQTSGETLEGYLNE